MPPFIFKIVRPLLARLWLLTRGLTLGVRAIVIRDGEVLLIRHFYTPGWTFPGGGVEVGETAEEALRRELSEEANVTLTDPPVLHGVFHQPRFSRRDHVLVYVAGRFSWPGAHPPNREIVECRFFPLGALPEDLSPGARRRLAEICQGAPKAHTW